MYEIIDVVERIRRMDRILDAKEAEIAAAAAAMESEVGYKKTVARCQLQHARVLLDSATAEYNDLGASIPAPEEFICGYSIGRIADLRIKRGDLLRDKEGHGERMVAEEEKLKSGPWRRKGAPTPPVILEIQSKMADIDLAVARFDAEIAEWMKGIRDEEAARVDKQKFAAWMADETDTVSPPDWVIERQKEEREEILRNSVRLEIVTPAVIARRAAEQRVAAEETARVAAEEAVWIAEEAKWRARQKRGVAKQREFFARLIAANKRSVAARQVVTPVLVVEECA